MDSTHRPLREALARRISGFPGLIWREQARAWLVVALGLVLMAVLVYQTLRFSMALVGWATADWDPAIRFVIEGLALVGLTIFGYRVVARWIDKGYLILRQLVATRARPWRTVGVQRVHALLTEGVPLGLYLRSYFDEEWLIPRSRLEGPARLAGTGLAFIAVENSQARFQPHALLILSVPNGVWKETVFTLMDLAQVIVLDTVTDTLVRLDWARGLPVDLGFISRETETLRRAGTVDELEHILERGHAAKTVILAPRNWHDDVASGKVARQIAVEEALARERHGEILRVRGTRPGASDEPIIWFARTRMKRALLRMPNVVCSLDELDARVRALSSAPAASA